MVCDKHKNFEMSTGRPIMETPEYFVSHYPVVNREMALRGHLLIEPKRHVVDAAELSDGEAQGLGLLIRDSIKLLTKELGAEHAYVFRINDKVPHFHVHIVPRFSGTPKESWGHKITEWPGAVKLDLPGVQAVSGRLRKNN